MYCDCVFCEENRFILNENLELNIHDWIIYEDENVFITPDIAPVVEGHFLIVANKHIDSFANGNIKTYQSVIKAKEYLKKKIYQSEKVLFFEHGAVIPHMSGGCIDHAHIHAIPLKRNINIEEFLEKHHLLNTERYLYTYEKLKEFAKKQEPYISYETDRENIIRRAYRLPSQFFRLLVATYYPKEHNWKIAYKTELSKKMLEDTLKMVYYK